MKKALLVVLVSLFLFASCDTNKRDNIIKLGFNLPLTGDLSTYGTAIMDGASLAVDHISRTDSTIVFDCDFQDNQSVPNQAVNIFAKQKGMSLDVYISGVKPQTMSIVDQVEKLNIPHFAWVFDAYITEQYDNVFRTWVNYKMEPLKFFDFIDTYNPKTIGIIYVQLPHTDEEVNDIILPKLKEKGIRSFVEKYPIDKINFKDIALKIKEKKCDLLIVNGFKSNLISITKSLKEYSLTDETKIIFSYDMLDASEELDKDILEGLNIVVPQFETRIKNEEWNKAFFQKFKRKPRYTDAYAYDMIYAIYFAYKQKDKPMKEALLGISFNGITGNFSFDKTGDLLIQLDIAHFNNGNLIYE